MSEIHSDVVKRFRNFYRCSECGTEWQDEWDSTCNDRCPRCNAEIEPYKSEDIPPEIDFDRAMDIINKRAEPKDDAELAAAMKVLTRHHDPDSMTDVERAIWWENECRRVSKEEAAARMTLAKLLKCPATWKYILPAILKRIG